MVRHLIATDRGRLVPGPARWNQYYFAGTPESALGLAYDDVTIAGDSGPLPAWFVPAAGDVEPSATWAVLVHGRGASREEGLRAVPVLRRLGIASLVIGYRNDVDALRSPSGRYHLGASEWRDVEAAVLHAVRCGAERIVLVGWSMGGAITLQLLDRSWLADRVVCAVLDAPVISWRDVLDHHARVNRLPRAVGRLAQGLLDHGHGRRLAALEMPLGLDSMDWVTRAGDLRTPLLVLHSDDDDFVPSGPSRALAERRPELVTFASSRGARHTKEWNVDPTGWETTVETYLRRWVPTASAPSGSAADERPPESSVADL